jgi:hypothetical protein
VFSRKLNYNARKLAKIMGILYRIEYIEGWGVCRYSATCSAAIV